MDLNQGGKAVSLDMQGPEGNFIHTELIYRPYLNCLAQGWKLISCSHCQGLCQQAS